MEIDERNPFTPEEVEIMLRVAFAKEIERGVVETQILKVDVLDFNRGRGAAFNFVELETQVPEHIKRISATEIRKQIRAGEDGWRDKVMSGVEPYLEAKFSG
jgi:nicotinamide mononucleotide adenylyltransferase